MLLHSHAFYVYYVYALFLYLMLLRYLLPVSGLSFMSIKLCSVSVLPMVYFTKGSGALA